MVEDGHVATSYPCGPSTYYLRELNAKQNDSRCNNNNNNNSSKKSGSGDSYVVVVEEYDRPEPTFGGGNCANSLGVGGKVAAPAIGNLRLPTNETNSKNGAAPSAAIVPHFEETLNSSKFGPQQQQQQHQQQQLQPQMAASAPDSNGSSHADRLNQPAATPNHHPHLTSQQQQQRQQQLQRHHHHHHFYGVTKEAESGNGNGSCRMLNSAPAAGADSGDGCCGGVGGGGGVCGDERNFPQEVHKTALAFGLLIFNFFLTTTSLAIIHDKVPSHGPLPDAVLDVFEARAWALIVSEVLIILTTGIMLVIIVTHRHRFIIFRRLFLMLSLLYFMRSVTMFVTVLPVSSKTYFCSPKSEHPAVGTIVQRSLTLFFGMGLTLNGKHTYCGDYIYSGHTTILVMSYLMISEYSPWRLAWLRWATWAMSLTGVLMVLLSHSHYTVDVLIGYFVTTRLFWMYHTCANNQFLKRGNRRNNYLAREWWYCLFQYFERNVGGPLQPLNCAR